MSSRVVLLHAGVINKHMWSPVIDHLQDVAETVAIDLPGHGKWANRPFRMSEAVDMTADHAGESAVLVGLSLGGYVAQAAATVIPDRVAGLVLAGATIDYRGWGGLTTRAYGMVFPLLARSAIKAFKSKLRSDFPAEVAEPIIAGGLSARGGGQALRRLPGTDYAAGLAVYSGPIALASGERDMSNREGESRFMELNPQAVSTVIEDAGHACALQQPAAFAAVIADLLASAR